MKAEGAQTVYYHDDRLGSTTHLTDASGTVVERYRYTPFGSAFIRNAECSLARHESAYNNRFLYTGREWLAKIGLYDYRNRAYSPNLGRFMQPDPIGFDAGDVNIYRYVGNSVINARDPSGLWPEYGHPKERCDPDLPLRMPFLTGKACRNACWAAGGACTALCTGSGPAYVICLAGCGLVANECSERCPP